MLLPLRITLRLAILLVSGAFSLRGTSHGSSSWASIADRVRGGVWGRGHGLIFAETLGHFIRYRSEGRALVNAPMGSGTGVGLVIPNLTDHPGALICTDPKGDDLAITNRWRTTLGTVYRLDALHPETAHRFNPFDMIRTRTHHQADDIAGLADLLFAPKQARRVWL